MSIIEAPQPENPIAESAPPNRVNPAKRAFIAFTATTTIGLGLAGWYVGGRIFAAEKIRPVVIAKAEVPRVTPIPEVPAEEPTLAPTPPTAHQNAIAPKSGEIYIQLAAMGPHATDDYIKVLDEKGIQAQIAPGPTEGLFRILVGPYPDNVALQVEQQKLQAAGIDSMVRLY